MFDKVNYEMNCPNCNKIIDNFQTKSGKNLLINLDVKDISFGGTFYARCDECNLYVNFQKAEFEDCIRQELGSIIHLSQKEILKKIKELKNNEETKQ